MQVRGGKIDTKGLVILTVCLGAVFFVGYRVGGKSPVVSRAVNSIAPARPQFKPEPVAASAPDFAAAVTSGEKYSYATLMAVYIRQGDELRSKIIELANVSEYLRKKAEEVTPSTTLEESLVNETRYRDSLNVLISAQSELNNTYEKSLQLARDYVKYLEAGPPAKDKH